MPDKNPMKMAIFGMFSLLLKMQTANLYAICNLTSLLALAFIKARVQPAVRIMRARISKIFLLVYALWLMLSMLLLSVPGDSWFWYQFLAIFAVVPIFAGPSRYRLFGAMGLLLSLIMVFGDIELGKLYRQKMQQLKDQLHSTNQP